MRGSSVLAHAALAAVLIPLGLVCWIAVDEIGRCGRTQRTRIHHGQAR